MVHRAQLETVLKLSVKQRLNIERTSERDEINSSCFSCILSFTPVIVADVKEMCSLSTSSTAFFTVALGNGVRPVAQTHTQSTNFPLNTHLATTSSYHHSSAQLGCEGNRDYAGACRAWTITHALGSGSADGSGPWSKPEGHRCFLPE